MEKTISLGGDTASKDAAMLSKAFFAPAFFADLINLEGFRVVVGRRGAGKSAVMTALSRKAPVVRHEYEDQDFELLNIVLSRSLDCTTYEDARLATNAAWRLVILAAVVRQLLADKRTKLVSKKELESYLELHKEFTRLDGIIGVRALIEKTIAETKTKKPAEIADALVRGYNLQGLKKIVSSALEGVQLTQRPIICFDGLDEGWTGGPLATGAIGGLIKAAHQLEEGSVPVRVLILLRDSMLREVAARDSEFARNIESNIERLDWNVDQLFRLIGMRIRASQNMDPDLSHQKCWNLVVDGELKNEVGFSACVSRTLLRPRDAIQLLNAAFKTAAANGRDRILISDVEAADRKWSKTRLNDLVREYSDVFPGLAALVNSMEGAPDIFTHADACARLCQAIADPAGDMSAGIGIFENEAGAFDALFALGFLGVKTPNGFRFSFDGTPGDSGTIKASSDVIVHPCYWAALGINRTEQTNFIGIDDTHDAFISGGKAGPAKSATLDERTRLIGKRWPRLTSISLGKNEESKLRVIWGPRATGVSLQNHVSSIRLHSFTKDKEQSRIVGRIEATSGVLQRIRNGFKADEVVFWLCNEAEITHEHTENIIDACKGRSCGGLVFVIRREVTDEPSKAERAVIKTVAQRGTFAWILPARWFEKAATGAERKHLQRELFDKLSKSLTRHENIYAKEFKKAPVQA
jgi:hypothetical protein